MQNNKLKNLGERLRQARIARHEIQQLFADRLGISRPTLTKMEAGDPSVSIGSWVKALQQLDRIDELDRLVSSEDNLFEKYEQATTTQRRRASIKRV